MRRTFRLRTRVTLFFSFIALLAGVVTLLTALGLWTTASAGAAAAGCQVKYTVGGQWPGGFTASVAVTNLGDPINGWRLGWTFPAGQRITQAWNATCTQSGTAVSCANAAYNGTVPDGGSVTFGFNASWSGSNPVPAVTLE